MGNASKQEMVLVIDDDPGMSTLVQGLTGYSNTQVVCAATLADGVERAGSRRFDVILLDHSLPDGEGLDRIEALLQQDRLRPILYITAQSGSQTAIEAIKRGAYEYLSKPIEFSLLRKRIAEAIEYRHLTRLPVMVESETLPGINSDVLVGRCRAMQDVYKAIGRLATLSSPALIEGEVGTGKEMIARAIHQYGSFKDKPFQILGSVEINAYFSHSESPFNITIEKSGPLESQYNGTLFVEEIGEVSLGAQQRILRWLQTQTTDPNGIPNVRLIFSSSVPSRELVDTNRLRSDFFYFLSPYIVRVPALRNRTEDFDLLIAHFMQRLVHISSADGRSGPPRVSSSALQLLKSYNWPGNVAQLKSVLQSVLMESRGAVLATDTLSRALETQTENLSEKFHQSERSLPSNDDLSFEASTSWDIANFVKIQTACDTTELYELAVAKLDLLLITQVLMLTQGNQAHAARILGMTRTSLRKKIHACHIDPMQFIQQSFNEQFGPEADKGSP